MTIVGQAELDIRAVGAQFTSDINRVAKPGLASAGAEADKTARGMTKSFGAVWTAFGTQSQGALGPVSTVIDQIQTAAEAIGKNASLAQKGMAAGAVGAGVGVGLQALGSGELAAQQQLQLSIENLGKSYDDYDGQIEKTIKSGERHGHTSEDTMRVLNQLTIATKDPKKALAEYSIVMDMAAVRHVPLQTAARMLSMVYAGNSRALKTFGIDLTQGTKALAAQKTATDAHTAAQDKLKKARQNLLDVEARVNASRQGHKATADQVASASARVASAESAVAVARFKHGQASPQAAAAEARLAAAEDHLNTVRAQGTSTTALTVSQQIDLRKAHEAVREAEKNVVTSAGQMASAHKDAAGAVTNADDAIKLLAERVRGQAEPATHTFSGQLHAFWATAEDDLAQFGNKWGGTVTGISTGVLATSALLEGASSVWSKFSGSGATAASAVEGDMESMATSGRMSMGRLTGAIGGVALAIGTMEVGKATAGSGASGAAATSLMGAVSGAAIGFSVGGPFGAAVGGAVGMLAGLATHFHDAAAATDASTTAMKNWMTTAYEADQFKIGEQFTQQLLGALQKQPGAAGVFATAGVKVGDIEAAIRAGNPLAGPAAGKLQKAARAGKISQQDYAQAFDALQTFVNNFGAIADNLDNLATIAGKTSQHTSDVLKATRAALAEIYSPLPAGSPSTYKPPSLADLLTPPTSPSRAHRAAGGPVFPGSSYIVGENGPETLTMGGRQSGFINPNLGTQAPQIENLLATLLSAQMAGNAGVTAMTGHLAKISANTADTHKAVEQRNGSHRFSNSPELATV